MMDASWVTNLWPYSLQVGLLVIAIGAVLALLRPPSPRLRLIAWRVVLAVALLLPLQPWRVVRVVDADAAVRARAETSTTADAANAAERGKTTDDELARPASGTTATSASTSAGWMDAISDAMGATAVLRTISAVDWTFAIAATLIGGAICRLLWLALGWHRLHRRLHRYLSVSLAAPTREDTTTELQQTFGTAARVEWIDDLSQPITFGVWPPVVLLPTRLAALPAEMQRAVICHELLHVQRRDWLWVLGEEIVRAAFWFHPAVWWLLDQLQAAREELVDRLTLRATGQRRAYLEALLAFAAEPEEPIAGAAAAFFRSRQLGRRIASLMREGTMTRTQRIATVIGLSLTLAAALAAAVITFPLQATAAAAVVTTAAAPPASASPTRVGADVAPRASAQATGATSQTPAPRITDTQAPRTRVTIKSDGNVGPIERKARTLAKDAPAPKRIVDVPFQFPPELATYATSALLQLRLVLDESGAVVESRVLSVQCNAVTPIASHPAIGKQMTSLGERTLEVVRQWRYEPIQDAPLALTVTVNYDARARKWNASDDAKERVVYKLVNKKPVKPVREDDDSMLSGHAGGVSGGAPGGVAGGAPGGVAGGVPGGVAGGVPGEDRVLRPRPGEDQDARPGLLHLARAAVEPPQMNETPRNYPGHLRLSDSGTPSPRVIEEARPRYPADAMKNKVQGHVLLDLEVDADGRVTDTHVIDSLPGLDEAAVDAAKKWRFEPTVVDGRAVPVVISLLMTFTMR